MGAGLVRGDASARVSERVSGARCLMDLRYFEQLQRFPHHSQLTPSLAHSANAASMRLMAPAASLDLSTALVVFVSHAWLRTAAHSHTHSHTHSHPDDAHCSVFRLCRSALQRLHALHAASLPHCFVWLDYACVAHPEWEDSLPRRRHLHSLALALAAEAETEECGERVSECVSERVYPSSSPALTYQHLKLDEIFQYCDCMLTPALTHTLSLGHTAATRVLGWNDTSACYMNRCEWSRVELTG